MGLKAGCFAKVWSAKVGQYAVNSYVTVSKAERDEEGNVLKDDHGKSVYKQLFNGFVSFIGDAKDIIESFDLPESMDRNNPVSKSVKIVSSPDLTSWYDAKTKKGGVNISIREIEVPENESSAAQKAQKKASASKKPAAKKEEDSSSDDLPF